MKCFYKNNGNLLNEKRLIWFIEDGPASNSEASNSKTDQQEVLKAEITPEELANPEAPAQLSREAENKAKDAMAADAEVFRAEIMVDPEPPYPNDPALDILEQKSEFTPEAREAVKEELRNFSKKVVKLVEELGFEAYMELTVNSFQERGIPLSEEEKNKMKENIDMLKGGKDEDLDRVADGLLKMLSPSEVEAINNDPASFKYNEEFILNLAEKIWGKADGTSKQDTGGEGDEAQEANEGPTEEEQQANELAINEFMKNPDEKLFLQEGALDMEVQRVIYGAFLEQLKTLDADAFAKAFRKAGPEAAKKALQESYTDFLKSLTPRELEKIEKKEDFKFKKVKLDVITVSLLRAQKKAEKTTEFTEAEKKQAENIFDPQTHQGLQELLEVFGVGLSLILELADNGDYAGALDAFMIGSSGENAEDARKETQKSYAKAIREQMSKGKLGFDGLIALWNNPRGELADSVFAGQEYFRKDGGEEAKKILSTNLGVDLTNSEVEGEENEEKVVLEFMKDGNEFRATIEKTADGRFVSVEQKVNGSFQPTLFKIGEAPKVQEATNNPAAGGEFVPITAEKIRINDQLGVGIMSQLKGAFMNIQVIQGPPPEPTPQPESTTDDNQPK